MSLTNTENIRDEIDKLFRHYIDGIKARTKCNLNDSSINGEGFIRNLLNLLYSFNLNRDRIESAYNETIDLHDIENNICIQVTARNDKKKIETTLNSFVAKRKYDNYDQLHFFILDREISFKYDRDRLKEYGTTIHFHDYTTFYKKLCSLDSYNSILPIYNFVQQELGNPENTVEFYSPLKEKFKDLHIIDQIHEVLKLFEGFSCIHPRTIAKLWPFNIGDYTSDAYSSFCLKTSNKDIHKLLEKIEIKDFQIKLQDDKLSSYKGKLKEIFTILNHSMIRCICYREKFTEIEHHKILIV